MDRYKRIVLSCVERIRIIAEQGEAVRPALSLEKVGVCEIAPL